MRADLAARVNSIDSSGIRRVFDLAQSIENPINMSIGLPDFGAEPELIAASRKALEKGHNQYTLTQGIPPLRAAISQKYNLDSHPETDLIVTSGVSGAIVLSFMALLDPEDELLMPDPFFCLYRDLAAMLGARPVLLDTYPDFALTAEGLKKALTPKTKAIVLNSPSNPTGKCISPEELSEVVEFAREAGIWIIYDEIYESFCYDQPHISPFGQYEKVVVLNGFSKSHGITGWRVGYALGPSALIEAMVRMQQYSFVCAPAPFSICLVGALFSCQGCFELRS